MRLPYYIKKIKEEEKSYFTFDTITNTLFFNQPPLITIKPFKHLSFSNLRYSSFTFSITISHNESLLTKISNSLIRFNDYKVNDAAEKILKLPYWLYLIIVKEYNKLSKQWITYYTDNILEYCKEFEMSKLNWASVKLNLSVSFLKEEPSIEQKLWIKTNQSLDMENITDYVEAVKKSLFPWLDYDLYKEMKKREDGKRINVNYEENREKMLLNEFNYKEEEKQLDIIE